MRVWRFLAWLWPKRAEPAAEASPPTGSAGTRNPKHSPYSSQYETVIAQGHTRPTPSFGAPALVWHVGIWPRRTVERGSDKGQPCDPHDTAGLEHKTARQVFDTRRHLWIRELNDRLERIEATGRWRRDPSRPGRPKRFLPNDPPDANADFWDPPKQAASASVGLTLWWQDPAIPIAERAAAAMRVRLNAELTADFATFSFFMDVTQLWNGASLAPAGRREELLDAVGAVGGICEAQLAAAAPGARAAADGPALPERLAPGQDDELLAARNLLYVKVWEAFARDMSCSLEELAGTRGEVFANFRGLIMPTSGLDGTAGGSSIDKAPFPKFTADARFDADGPEANAVVKAFWPFVRRITPGADYREFIACGVMNWRALYVTALGASSQWDPEEERATSPSDKTERDIGVRDDVLGGTSPATPEDDGNVWRRAGREGNNHPVRYLLLTKGDPNPRQIGRIVERINSMGTTRLYALKDSAAIREADCYIRILGQELDKITRDWSDKRQLIEGIRSLRQFSRARKDPEFASIHKYLREIYVPGKISRTLRQTWSFLLGLFTFWELKQLVHKDQLNAVLDTKYALLHEVSRELETELIALSAALDEIGWRTAGGLHFRINRSAYHAAEFHRLLKTLNVGNIQTWISYEQFVRRGLAPAFKYVASVGARIRSLRDRLQTVTDTIETSALVGQSAATRYNTAVLRQATTVMFAVLAVYLTKLAFPGLYSELFAYLRLYGTQAVAYLWGVLAASPAASIWYAVLGALVIAALVLAAHRRVRAWIDD